MDDDIMERDKSLKILDDCIKYIENLSQDEADKIKLDLEKYESIDYSLPEGMTIIGFED